MEAVFLYIIENEKKMLQFYVYKKSFQTGSFFTIYNLVVYSEACLKAQPCL